MSEISEPRASVLDIVTFGYKLVAKRIKSISILTLPVVLLYGIFGVSMALLGPNKEHISMEAGLAALGGLLVFIPGVLVLLPYTMYCISRLIRDIYMDEENENVFSYFVPKISLLGVIGLALLISVTWMAALIPAVLAMILGLVLLIIPGIAVAIGFVAGFRVWSQLLFVSYLRNPEDGVFAAFSNTWNLLRENKLRAVALGVITGLVYMILTMPFSLFEQIPQIVDKLSPSLLKSQWGAVIYMVYGISITVGIWVTLVVGEAGTMSVINRFYTDLDARHNGPSDPVPLQRVQPFSRQANR